MNDYQIKQKEAQENRNLVLAKILEGITPAIKERGLVAELVSMHNEYNKKEICISDPSQENFEATICFNAYNDGKASLYFKDSKTVIRKHPPTKYVKEDRYTHEQYSYISYTSEDVLLGCGLEKVNYSMSLTQLRKEFKATKSAKLILNDILPKIDIYKKVVEATAEQVEKNIKVDEEYIALKNLVMKKAGYSYGSNDLSSLSTTIKGLGSIDMRSTGMIDITYSVTREELRELLK